MDTEYHKGQLCIYKFMLCQEGFCSRCAILHEHQKNKISIDVDLYTKKLVNAKRKELVPS
jgi:hypothetical protein